MSKYKPLLFPDGGGGVAPTLALDQLGWAGSGLKRPECVLAMRSGTLLSADWDAVIARTDESGRTVKFGDAIAPGRPSRPNGIALDARGRLLFADLGDTHGGLFRLDDAGGVELVADEVDGVAIPPSNFVLCDRYERIWLTVSTRVAPRQKDFNLGANTGFIVVFDRSGARIVADGLGFANECAVSADGKHLYVNETYTRKFTRFTIGQDVSLSERTVITTFGTGNYPDGIALDEAGHAWITSIVSNRVIRVAPDGEQQLILDGADPAYVQWVEDAFLAGTLSREHIDRVQTTALKHVSSLAFGGPDLRTCYLGSLHGDRIACFRSPVAGLPLLHHQQEYK